MFEFLCVYTTTGLLCSQTQLLKISKWRKGAFAFASKTLTSTRFVKSLHSVFTWGNFYLCETRLCWLSYIVLKDYQMRYPSMNGWEKIVD